MNNRKVICLVINSLGGGGAERVFARLANMLQNEELEYKIIVITLDEEPIVNSLSKDIEHIKLGYNGSLLKSMLGLRKVLTRLSPSLVVSFLTRSNVAAVFASFGQPYRVVISERVNTSSHFGYGFTSKVKKSFTRFFYEKADFIVAVSEGVKKDLGDFFKLKHKKIDVIYNSYNYEELLVKSQEYSVEFEAGSYIVCVGRFYENKNHALLLKALAEANLPKTLVLLGDGPKRNELEKLVIRLKLQNKVIFKGFVSNPYPYIKNSAGLISTSLAEGFPNVIAEALVLGKFVVSSDCQSGPAELLDSRVSEGVKQLQEAKYGILLPVNNQGATTEGIEMFNNIALIEHYETQVAELKLKYSHENFLSSFSKIIKEGTNE
nr:glycosyltransferase [Pseudoalteromonas sp. TB13]